MINASINRDDLNYFLASNEGEAVALAAGSWIGGESSLIMFQNSGLGNAINPLTSLLAPFKIPTLGVVSVRSLEPQHRMMGEITEQLLDLMKIKWAYLPEVQCDLDELFMDASACLKNRESFFFLAKKNSFVPVEKENKKIDTFCS